MDFLTHCFMYFVFVVGGFFVCGFLHFEIGALFFVALGMIGVYRIFYGSDDNRDYVKFLLILFSLNASNFLCHNCFYFVSFIGVYSVQFWVFWLLYIVIHSAISLLTEFMQTTRNGADATSNFDVLFFIKLITFCTLLIFFFGLYNVDVEHWVESSGIKRYDFGPFFGYCIKNTFVVLGRSIWGFWLTKLLVALFIVSLVLMYFGKILRIVFSGLFPRQVNN